MKTFSLALGFFPLFALFGCYRVGAVLSAQRVGVVGSTNARFASFGRNASVAAEEIGSTRIAISEHEGARRELAFWTVGKPVPGERFDLGRSGDLYRLTFSQKTAGLSQRWTAVSGTVTVVEDRKGSTALEIAGAHFRPTNLDLGTAAGEFEMTTTIPCGGKSSGLSYLTRNDAGGAPAPQ